MFTRSRCPDSRYRRRAAVVGPLMLLGTVLSGCGTDPDDVPAVPGRAVADAGDDGPPPASSTSMPDPDLRKKLKAAERALERQRREPNSYTVCLNPDGTLLGEVEHARAVDAPPLTKEDKRKVCEKQPLFQNPADNPASRAREGAR